MAQDLDLAQICDVLKELQRGFREDPFFAELFGTRDTGFRAASSGVAPEALSDISREQIEWTWLGLCDLLGVSIDVDIEDLDDLLDQSTTFEA